MHILLLLSRRDPDNSSLIWPRNSFHQPWVQHAADFIVLALCIVILLILFASPFALFLRQGLHA